MSHQYRILHLEDSGRDADLIEATLAEGGLACSVIRAKGREEFERAILEGGMDIVLSDFSLPQYDGLAALEFAKSNAPALPFILLSGTLGEELAVECLKKGATDYILKQRLNRLAPAVNRAVREAKERAEKKNLETQFLQMQRLESIGALAGGIAHD